MLMNSGSKTKSSDWFLKNWIKRQPGKKIPGGSGRTWNMWHIADCAGGDQGHFSSRGRGRRRASQQETGNGKATEFWRRTERGEPGEMTSNTEEKQARWRGGRTITTKTAQYGVQIKYVRMWYEQKGAEEKETKTESIKLKKEEVRMNEIKITMERWRERFPRPAPPLLLVLFTVQGPGATGASCTNDQGSLRQQITEQTSTNYQDQDMRLV